MPGAGLTEITAQGDGRIAGAGDRVRRGRLSHQRRASRSIVARWRPDRARRRGRSISCRGGKPPGIGERYANPALARDAAPDRAARARRLLRGPVAAEMVARLRALGGLHTLGGFRRARASRADADRAGYRGHSVHECPPNGQGLAALIISHILGGYDLGEDGRARPTASTCWPRRPRPAMPRATADRRSGAADEHCRAAAVGDACVDALRAPIRPSARPAPSIWDGADPSATRSISCVVDRDRNVVSFINSLFAPFRQRHLCARVRRDAAKPRRLLPPVAGHPNAIAPRKRPLHTIIPRVAAQTACR